MVSTLESSGENRGPQPGTMFVPVDLSLLRSNGINTGLLPDSLQRLITQGFLRSDQLIDPADLKTPETSSFKGPFYDLCRKRGITQEAWDTSIVPVIRIMIKGYRTDKTRRSGEAPWLHPIMVAMAVAMYAPPSLCPDPTAMLRILRCSLLHDYVEDTIFKQPDIPALPDEPTKTDAKRVFETKFFEGEDRLVNTEGLELDDTEARIIMALTVDKKLNILGAHLSNHYDQLLKLSGPKHQDQAIVDMGSFIRSVDKAVNLFSGEADRDVPLLEDLRRWLKQLHDATVNTFKIVTFVMGKQDAQIVAHRILADSAHYVLNSVGTLLPKVAQEPGYPELLEEFHACQARSSSFIYTDAEHDYFAFPILRDISQRVTTLLPGITRSPQPSSPPSLAS